ncbi:MAG TPA: ATP-binding protein [Pyrinomonadaceae bacterium]|nr:ATP-binding protein [Pyrinomonadaceae bacterium]
MTREQRDASFHSEELFRLVAEKVEDFAVFALDLNGVAASWNPGVEKLLGYAEDQFLGLDTCVLFTREDNERGECEREMRVAAEHRRAEDRRWHIRRDGTRFWANGLLMALPDEAGVLRGYAKILRDETARKEVEDRLRESEAFGRNILESISDAFYALDREWRFTYLNRRCEPILRRSREELLGKNIWEEFPDATGTIISEQFHKAVAERVTVTFETFYQPLDAWIEVRAYPSPDGLSVYFHDINKRKQAERERERLLREAQEANQLKDDFLAMLSHELRTPLTAILGWSRLLQMSDFDKEATARALLTIERNAQAQTQLIDDLLDTSRIITGKMRLDVRPVDLASVIVAAVDTARPAAEAKDINLQTILDTQADPISGDPDRLQQVVWNLLSNAIKFTPKGGRVQVRLERVDSHIEITVADTGRGIAPEFLPHVFDRFRQADQTTTRTHGGLGLGLAIVRQLAELHGGSVRVESGGEGRGTSFCVSLPLLPLRQESVGDAPRAPALARSEAKAACPPELDGLRVLVVDDEPDTRELLAAVLTSCGARVIQAATAVEAFEHVERTRPDVLITDIGMPEEDGYSLLARIRSLPPERGGGMPAAALTAYARAEDRVRVLRSGFQMHVPKPVEPAELITVVANLAGRLGGAK